MYCILLTHYHKSVHGLQLENEGLRVWDHAHSFHRIVT